MKLTWPEPRYVEESSDKKAKMGSVMPVQDVIARLQWAARQSTGVISVGYYIPFQDQSHIFAFSEAMRMALGFERTPEDLQVSGGIAHMWANQFDRFVRDVPGRQWRLRLTAFGLENPKYPDQPENLLQLNSGTVYHRLLEGDDVTQVLVPFVRYELEPILQRYHII